MVVLAAPASKRRPRTMEHRADLKKQSFTDVFPPAGTGIRSSVPAASTVTLTSVDSETRTNNNRTPLAPNNNNNSNNITNMNAERRPPTAATTIASSKHEEKHHQSYREAAKLRTRKSFSDFSSGLKQGVHEIASAAKRLSINRMRHKYSKKDLHSPSHSQTHSSSINLAGPGQASSSSSPRGILRPHSQLQLRPHASSIDVSEDGVRGCAIPPVPPLPAPFHQRSHTQGNALASPQSLPPVTDTASPATTSTVVPSPLNNDDASRNAANGSEIISPRPTTSAADSQYSNHARTQDRTSAEGGGGTSGAAALAEPSSEGAEAESSSDGQATTGTDAPMMTCKPSLADSKIFVAPTFGEVRDKERDRVFKKLNEKDRDSKVKEVSFGPNLGESEPLHETDTESGVDVTECNDAEEDEISEDQIKKDPMSRFPPEIIHNILTFLDAQSLKNAELVNRTWRAHAASHHVWRDLFVSEYQRKLPTIPSFHPSSSETGPGLAYRSRPCTPVPSTGLGRRLPNQDWKKMYSVRQALEQRWKDGKAAAIYLHGHTDSVYCVQFDEKKIITGGRDKTIRIWDAHYPWSCLKVIGPPGYENPRPPQQQEQQQTQQQQQQHQQNPGNANAQQQPQGGHHHHHHHHHHHNRPPAATVMMINAATSDARTPFIALSPNQRKQPEVITPSDPDKDIYHMASILCLQFDKEIMVTGSSDSTCIVWDVRKGSPTEYRPIRRLRGHTAGVLDVCFDDRHVVSCSKDTTICIWSRKTGAFVTRLLGHHGPVNAVQLRGDLVVSASGDGIAKLWNIANLTINESEEAKRNKNIKKRHSALAGRRSQQQRPTSSLSASHSASSLPSPASSQQQQQQQQQQSSFPSFAGPICVKEFASRNRGFACVEFSPDTRTILAGGNDQVIYQFDTATGECIRELSGHSALVRSLHLDALNHRVVSGSYDMSVKVFDTRNGEVGVNLPGWTTSWILSAKADYRRIVAASQDSRAVIVDFGYGLEGVELLEEEE